MIHEKKNGQRGQSDHRAARLAAVPVVAHALGLEREYASSIVSYPEPVPLDCKETQQTTRERETHQDRLEATAVRSVTPSVI